MPPDVLSSPLTAPAPADVMGLDAAGVARVLGISSSHFFVLLKTGRFGPTPRRLGRAVRYDADEVRAWFKAGCPARHKWEVVRR